MRKVPYFIFMLSATAIVVYDKKKNLLLRSLTIVKLLTEWLS